MTKSCALLDRASRLRAPLLVMLLTAGCGSQGQIEQNSSDVLHDGSADPNEVGLTLAPDNLPADEASQSESGIAIGAGENWTMTLAVDNQFDVYFGTPWQTVGERVGQGTDWTREFRFEAEGMAATDHLYIATTSDQGGAQGFIGVFTNTTRNSSVVTGDAVWEVFAAGAHEATNPYWPEPWPKSVLPTQEQVDRAIAYAQANSLWTDPTFRIGFDNDPATDPTDVWAWNPWEMHHDGIPDDALWIWYDSGKIEDGRIPGVFTGGNHDEFLVFRLVGNTVERVTETVH